jgi:5-methylcytosine-specific restriction endonuclease McrA
MTYSEKLRDPRWQRKRLEIFSRDNWACRSCGSKEKNLQVHHLVYRKIDPWDYPDYLYQTLCDECHEARQSVVDKLVDALRISLMNVPTSRLEVVAQRLCNEAIQELTT